MALVNAPIVGTNPTHRPGTGPGAGAANPADRFDRREILPLRSWSSVPGGCRWAVMGPLARPAIGFWERRAAFPRPPWAAANADDAR